MIELITAFLRVIQASLELAVASNAQLAVLMLGVVGAAAVAVVVIACRALPALVAADSSGAAHAAAADRRPGRAPRAERPRCTGPCPSEGAGSRHPGRVANRFASANGSPSRRSGSERFGDPTRPDGSRIPRPQGHLMDLYAFPPIAALLDGAHAVLMGLADLLEPLVGASSAAAAVVLVTLLVRAALIPVGVSQAKAERTRARLAPQLAALQKKHQKDPERLQREMMSLYRSERHHAARGLPADAHPGADRRHHLRPVHPAHHRRAPRTSCSTHTFVGVPLGSSLAGSIASGTVTPDVLLVFGAVIVMIAASAR